MFAVKLASVLRLEYRLDIARRDISPLQGRIHALRFSFTRPHQDAHHDAGGTVLLICSHLTCSSAGGEVLEQIVPSRPPMCAVERKEATRSDLQRAGTTRAFSF
jgi:hypothetical protein